MQHLSLHAYMVWHHGCAAKTPFDMPHIANVSFAFRAEHAT